MTSGSVRHRATVPAVAVAVSPGSRAHSLRMLGISALAAPTNFTKYFYTYSYWKTRRPGPGTTTLGPWRAVR